MKTFLIVIDSMGVGELPDANLYGDCGSNTFLNIYNTHKMVLPNLKKLGLFNIDTINIEHTAKLIGNYGKMSEYADAKDSTAGHYEIAGILNDHPNPVFPQGFPQKLIEKLQDACGCEFIGNEVASGTEIIARLGAEHIVKRAPIIYTSADSVLQVACHEDVMSLDEQYKICEIIREEMTGKYNVSRVIARPFAGSVGEFYRLEGRKDLATNPPKRSMLEDFKENGLKVIGVGKIAELFNFVGISEDYHSRNNDRGMQYTLEIAKRDFDGLVFINLCDTDTLYGHRNDVSGYAKAIKDIDNFLPALIENLKDDDLLIITADHGCDPTTISTDHSREYVPLLVYGNKLKQGVDLGTLDGFNNIAISLLDHYNLVKDENSFLRKLYKDDKTNVEQEQQQD